MPQVGAQENDADGEMAVTTGRRFDESQGDVVFDRTRSGPFPHPAKHRQHPGPTIAANDVLR